MAESAAPSDIQVDTREEGAVVRTLEVVVEARRVGQAFDRAYRELARRAQIPGFRRGKIPRSVLEKRFGPEVADDLERQLVAETLPDAVELAEVVPVTEPSIDAEPPEPGSPFRYRARIEVRPEIGLPELAGLPAERPPVGVTDEDVEKELEGLRERHARLVEEAEDVPAAAGHTLRIDFVGRIDGEPFEGGSGQDVEIELGSGRMVPGFEEQLEGARAGSDVEVRVTFPDTYHEAKLRGREAVFAVHVASVQRRELPSLDDEFAKDLGDFEDLASLRGRVHDDLFEARRREAEGAVRRSLMDALVERTDFEVPAGLVERQIQQQAASLHRQFQGQLPEEILHAQIDRMREEGREAAERRVREQLLLHAVVAQEKIEASDDEVDVRLSEFAQARGLEVDALRRAARQQGFFESVRSELVEEKALDFLVSGANVAESAAD